MWGCSPVLWTWTVRSWLDPTGRVSKATALGNTTRSLSAATPWSGASRAPKASWGTSTRNTAWWPSSEDGAVGA